jgi:cell division protease FtsH
MIIEKPAVLETKKIKLKETQIKLKEKYIGIDKQIDKLIEQITMWYLYPEFQVRPTIINLFGLTGVGKTSLVRDLVKLLKFQNKYCEIELDNKASFSSYMESNYSFTRMTSTIVNSLFSINLKPSDSGILLFDEIHRFRTIDKKGDYHSSEKYSDIWKLLSDGSLYDKTYIIKYLQQEIENINSNLDYNIKNTISGYRDHNLSFQEKFLLTNGISVNVPNPYQQSSDKQQMRTISSPLESFMSAPRNGVRIATLLNLVDLSEEDREFIKEKRLIYQTENELLERFSNKEENNTDSHLLSTCSNKVMIEFLERKLKLLIESDKDFDTLSYNNDEYIYSKLLIILCGNLDDENFYKQKNVLTDDIVEELKSLFRPEQVSRFGKNFILYPILSKDDFEKLIDKELKLKNKQLLEKFSITLSEKEIDEIKSRILQAENIDYKQGVRPLFSLLGQILGEIIPIKLLEKTKENIKHG